MKRLRLSILLLPLALAGCNSGGGGSSGIPVQTPGWRGPANAVCPNCDALLRIGRIPPEEYIEENITGPKAECPVCLEPIDPGVAKWCFRMR